MFRCSAGMFRCELAGLFRFGVEEFHSGASVWFHFDASALSHSVHDSTPFRFGAKVLLLEGLCVVETRPGFDR